MLDFGGVVPEISFEGFPIEPTNLFLLFSQIFGSCVLFDDQHEHLECRQGTSIRNDKVYLGPPGHFKIVST